MSVTHPLHRIREIDSLPGPYRSWVLVIFLIYITRTSRVVAFLRTEVVRVTYCYSHQELSFLDVGLYILDVFCGWILRLSREPLTPRRSSVRRAWKCKVQDRTLARFHDNSPKIDEIAREYLRLSILRHSEPCEGTTALQSTVLQCKRRNPS